MSHVNLKTLLRDAQRRKYGVPNLWIGSIDKALGYIQAAESVGSPLCICYNSSLCPDIPVDIGVPLIVNAAEYANVPIATILDHGKDLDTILKCIHHKISSVMFDGSDLPFDENIRRTKEITRIAHVLGVSVEAELGAVGGSSMETGGYEEMSSVMTDPDQVKDFVAQTDVDALAISFGNSHGKYKGEPKLDFERVNKIASLVSIPLVMHGASGIDESDFVKVIDAGISKINYYTSMSIKTGENIRQKLREDDSDIGCHNLISWNIEFFKRETTRLLTLFRGAGKALDFDYRVSDYHTNCLTQNSDVINPLMENEGIVEELSEMIFNMIKTKVKR